MNKYLTIFLITMLITAQEEPTEADQEDFKEGVEDFFAAFEADPSDTDSMHDSMNMEEYNMMVDSESKKVHKDIKTTWFKLHEIDQISILDQISFSSMPPHEEQLVTRVMLKDLGEAHIYATRADEWCFLNFRNLDLDTMFFFACVDQLEGNETIILRKVSEDCPLPSVRPEAPPVAEICHMMQKKGLEVVDHIYEANGVENGDKVLECWISVVTKIEHPDVQTMCSKNAVEQGWSKITKGEIEDLERRAKDVTVSEVDGKEVTNYDMGNREETERIDSIVVPGEDEPVVTSGRRSGRRSGR